MIKSSQGRGGAQVPTAKRTVRTYTLTCDGATCGNTTQVTCQFRDTAFEIARLRGWAINGKTHYCPQHRVIGQVARKKMPIPQRLTRITRPL